MKKNISYLLAFLFIIIVSDAVMAQAPKNCGTSQEDLAEIKRQMFENRREAENSVVTRSNVVVYVPVRFHLVAESNGDGRVSERKALQAMCTMNENYAAEEVQFYLKEFNYINSNSLYNDPDGFSGGLNISANMIYDAINIFVVKPNTSTNGEGITQAYYQGPAGPSEGRDWLVCYQNFILDTYVLTHEIGHFLSLNHPFYGWDRDVWDPADHGNPVTLNNGPSGGTLGEDVEVELVNGSNCDTAADGICDTPADYNFGLTYNTNCNYTGNCRDANNELLTPLEENIMNYFGCSNQTFTAGQKVEIQNSLNSSSRNYCTPNYTPNLDEITGSTNLTFPGNVQTVETYNYVNLQWEAKAGATGYVVEITGAQNFSVIANSANLELTNLEQDATYFWRVMPFNEGYACGAASSQLIFKTGNEFTSTTEIAEIDEWTVAPNPVSSNQSIRVNIAASESFEANITLIDLTGKVVQTINNQRFDVGNATVEMNMNNLPAGLYSLSIQSKNGISNKRIVVTK